MLAGLGICDLNSLAGVVRGHVAAKAAGLPFRVGCSLRLDDGSEWLAWPGSRAAYGRLTALLAAAGGWVLAAIPPTRADADWPAQLRRDAAALRDRLALPLFLSASCSFRGADRHRLDTLAGLAAQIGTRLLATGDVRYHHPDRRRLADVLAAIRLRTTVDALGYAAEVNAKRHLKPPTEMARLFASHPEALANSLAALEATGGFSLGQLRYEYPDEVLEPRRSPQHTLAMRHAARHRPADRRTVRDDTGCNQL
jgi:error-prone DNA polymerase